VENGLATKNDLLKIEVQYNNNELLRINAANNAEIARTQFNKTLGIELNAKTEIDLLEPNTEEIKRITIMT
jgi:outer membrane protein TolC